MIRATTLSILLAFTPLLSAQADIDGEQLHPLKEWLQDNTRWAFDLSSRHRTLEFRGQTTSQNTFGIDLHKVFTSSDGDIGTLLIQAYVTRFDN